MLSHAHGGGQGRAVAPIRAAPAHFVEHGVEGRRLQEVHREPVRAVAAAHAVHGYDPRMLEPGGEFCLL